MPVTVPVRAGPRAGPGRPHIRPHGRGAPRDWVVDFSCFLLAVALGLTAAHSMPDEPDLPHSPAVLDQTLGALACAAAWLRRLWPVGLAIAMVPVGLLSNTSGGAVMVAVFVSTSLGSAARTRSGPNGPFHVRKVAGGLPRQPGPHEFAAGTHLR